MTSLARPGALPTRPWEDVPPDVAEVLRPELPGLAEEIIGAIAAHVPAYARPMEGAFGHALRVGVEEALRQFLELIEDPRAHVRPSAGEVYRALGRGELREGRTLDALQAAYRLGARVAWRRLARVGREAGLSADTLLLLAEALFAYIDELAAESVEGYAEAQSQRAGRRQRQRQHLLELLLDARPPSGTAIQEAASAAEWPLPRTVAAVALTGESAVRRVATRVGFDVLGGELDGLACLLVPDADGPARAPVLRRAVDGRPAGIGPAVPVMDARRSWEWACRALDALRRTGGSVPAGADDDPLDVLLLADEPFVQRLAARRLAPLGDLSRRRPRELAETLAALLAHGGNAVAAAERLHVHPQTVRYRLRRLESVLGPALEDPEARLELELALRYALRLGGGG